MYLNYCQQRIAKNAETLALKLNQGNENYTYYGNKAYDPEGVPLDKVQYLNCTPNRHFYGENVNTGFSSVHVPINIYHRGESVSSLPAFSLSLFFPFLPFFLS
jgi:hypothetical protein